MRLSTGAERALIAARRFRWVHKVEMQGVDGGWRDLTDLSARNWVNSCRWRWNLDQPVMAGELTLHRALRGGNILSNPDFAGGSFAGYSVYDNNATGTVTLSTEVDATAPNKSGYRLKIVHAAGAAESPGLGGIAIGIPADSAPPTAITPSTYRPQTYHRGATETWHLWANIPVGYSVDWAQNQSGSDGVAWQWLTSTAGTGQWKEYIGKLTIGTVAGVYNPIGFFFLTGGARPVTWYVAKLTAIDPAAPMSLSPLMGGSLLNYTGAGGAAGPQLDVRRKIRISTATLAPGTSTPAAGDWREMFQGYTDKYSLGGKDPTITIPFRDLGALLQNTIVEVERVYGSTSGVDGATVMQSILTDNAALLGVAITLAVPTAIPIAVYTYKLSIGTTIMDALNAIARKAGAVVRYKYNSATNVFELTFYAPDRTKVIPDYTFAASEYLSFEELEADIAGLRNIVYVPYTDSGPGGTGARLVASAQASPANLLQYGHLAMVLGQEATSQINTNTEAQNLANAAVADTAYPYSTGRALHDLTWWVEGGDLLRYMPDNKHTDAQLDIAVMQIEHVIQASDKEVTARTTITGRPNVAALYQTWLRLADGTGAGLDVPPSLIVTDTPGASPAAAHSVAYSGIYDSIELSVNGGPWGTPLASPLTVTPNPAGGVAKVLTFRATKSGLQTTQTVTVPAAGGAPSPPIITITQSSITAPTLSQETLTVAGSLGAGGAGPYQWRTRTLISNTGSTPAWGAFSATPALPQELTITRGFKWSKTVEVQAMDAAGVITQAGYVVLSRMDAMDNNGVVDDQHAASSGALLFRRTVDNVNDIVSTSIKGFIHPSYTTVLLQPNALLRTSTLEIADNLFKRGTDSAADVVTTTTRTFVDPNSATQVDASGRIVGVYRLGVYEPVNNLVKFGDPLGFTGASSINLNGSVVWKIVLSGSPTIGQQISIGDSSVFGAIGSEYSSGFEFMSHNAYQNTYSADSWAQPFASAKSALFELGPNGLALYSAIAGKATAAKATFWGSAVFAVSELGNVNANNYYGGANRGVRIGNSFFGQQGSGYGEVGYNNSDGAGSANYFVSDFASRIRFNAGGISFQTAPSGTAGGAITFTERGLLTATLFTVQVPVVVNGYISVGVAATNGYIYFGTDNAYYFQRDTTTWGAGVIGTNGGITANGKILSGVSINASGQLRATGWYASGDSVGLGAEFGVSGGQSYLYSYNRTSNAYGVLNLGGSTINLTTGGSGANTVYIDDGANTKRQVACIIISSAAPTTETAPDGTLWART